jgi:hypothetical protein
VFCWWLPSLRKGGFEGLLPEAAARIVEFLGLLLAAREEGLVKSGRARRIGLLKLLDLRRHFFQAAHEGETFAVADVGSMTQGQFDLALNRVSPCHSFAHPAHSGQHILPFGVVWTRADFGKQPALRH